MHSEGFAGGHDRHEDAQAKGLKDDRNSMSYMVYRIVNVLRI